MAKAQQEKEIAVLGLTGWDVELPSEEQKEPQEWPGFARNERIEVERPGAMP